MKKIDFTQKILQLGGEELNAKLDCVLVKENGDFLLHNGKKMIRKIDTPEEIITFRRVCTDVLMKGSSKDENPKVDRFDLAIRIFNEDSLELTSEEVVDLKALIKKGWANLISGQACLMLEGQKLPNFGGKKIEATNGVA